MKKVSIWKTVIPVTIPSSNGTIFVFAENDEKDHLSLSSKILTKGPRKFTFQIVNNVTVSRSDGSSYGKPLYGFHDEEYVYFIIKKYSREPLMESSTLKLKLVRSSLNMSASSYDETDIACDFHSEGTWEARSAFLGQSLQEKDLSSSNDFSTKTLYVSVRTYWRNSVICGFSMKMIRQKFSESSKNCYITTVQNKSNIVCHNNYTSSPLLGVPLLSVEMDDIVKLAIDVQGNNTIAVFGDLSGYIVKALLGDQGNQDHLGRVLYKSRVTSRNFSDEKEMVMSKEGNETYAYIGTRSLLMKFPIN